MNEETRLTIDVPKTREKYLEAFHKKIDKSNTIWHSVLRLIITLSSSFLVITIAVVEKLFPSVNELPELLIVSWVLLFISLIFGIIAELNEAIFFANQATEMVNSIEELDKKIAKGIFTYVGSATPFVKYSSLTFGVVSINSFMIAILCLCLALLSKIKVSNIIIYIVLLVGVSFFFYISYYLIKKLKERPATTQSSVCDKSHC